jgi:hypothetical protein
LIHFLALVAHQFLNSTNQLTYYGLSLLCESLAPGQFYVLFRNNHFSTLFKHSNGSLYTLVTDQGFLREPHVVWETLSGIEGDSVFVDENFRHVVHDPPT